MEPAPIQVRDVAVSDSGFVFDPATGHTFTVNATGLTILRMLKDGVSEDEMKLRLASDFALESEDDPGRDIQDFVVQLRGSGLLR